MATESSHFEFDGFAEVSQNLENIKVTRPELQKRIHEAVWKVLGDVRKAVIQNAHFADSKHNSIAAIRRTVYKKIMGGNVNILSKGKGKANKGSFTATGQSARTQQINSYVGSDRGFILRFVNSGTEDRYAGEGRNKYLSRSHIQEMRGKPGFRGKITARNFFAPAATRKIQEAANMLAAMIESEINMEYYK